MLCSRCTYGTVSNAHQRELNAPNGCNLCVCSPKNVWKDERTYRLCTKRIILIFFGRASCVPAASRTLFPIHSWKTAQLLPDCCYCGCSFSHLLLFTFILFILITITKRLPRLNTNAWDELNDVYFTHLLPFESVFFSTIFTVKPLDVFFMSPFLGAIQSRRNLLDCESVKWTPLEIVGKVYSCEF